MYDYIRVLVALGNTRQESFLKQNRKGTLTPSLRSGKIKFYLYAGHRKPIQYLKPWYCKIEYNKS